ncbi:MAG: SdpI family protein [Roseburia sp.]|nr:SdpI family protein [Roseburia sp.]
MKVSKTTVVISSMVALLPMLAGILLWQRLPDTVATHFGANNQANGWSSKGFAVFGIPLFCLAAHLVCVLAVANDPRRANISGRLFGMITWICPLCSLLCGASVYTYALRGGFSFDVGMGAQLFVGLLLVIWGNYLPKCHKNYTVGVKLPWTLHDEENWNRTHRFAGHLWMGCGMLIMLHAFWNVGGIWTVIAVIAGAAVLPVIFSFVYYRRQQD